MADQAPRSIPALAVLGPTASGKSALGLWMADQGFPIEIISLDSALVFRNMDIGTAKPTPQELAMVPHHLIDIITPSDTFSAAEFVEQSHILIDDIRARGKVPVILGGTMMYYKTLISGMDDLPMANPSIRQAIEQQAEAQGWPAIHAQLAMVDPLTAARLKPNDSQRLQRALEVFQITGKPLSAFHVRDQQADAAIPTLAIEPSDRAVLHKRIEARFHAMLEQGLIEEVIELRHNYVLDETMPSMRCVGYRQVWEYLHGACTHQDMTEKGIAATRQLAKRQITWLRSTANKEVVDPLQADWLLRVKPWIQRQIDLLMPL
ncbi:MAG: tRNA (adenosine(37)-N6)-dimethylallyltransferase MiaA [Gammaproteobacteria bacterium]|uniref:tRNA (adenosine(37)-N6)-dimethylallyltransferase MiaA n=1 Tax=Limnobacter sp. TaxID=2003368 RepID=UPI001E04BB3B|nr:tRNA (adenosine(37)-N6)-dimethylallyltransferase MiaA [Limnobacter sp.]MBU0784014.1 tRNA (adenosine(37)-N6)-dimethylallyltransferase MiaA [Gammaproteobacteria bacterium]MBU0848910.1 tRNA (adenosine(37)-N6)-dimethylallyltransferase MiaA [Gammaproteobacteria bacterium]MBU1267244.1 tRNA (adenosine(37)-N6)-dimethylallyltransferase MiaA [Gammaproteobacteria bacterium]MBU1527835.1 tRNA (adenosine(37)-N6)-dimethylallyltransferase MiaA [Gammaproteobacteria bacterium]MBU1778877.1 tRNA (adenosine(37)